MDIAILKKQKHFLDLLHLCNPTFPTGGFNHSFGLETFIEDGIVKDKHSLIKILNIYINYQYKYTDGFAMKLIYDYLNDYKKNKDAKILKKIWELDEILSAQCMAYETHKGFIKIGQRTIETLLSIYPIDLLKKYQDLVFQEKCDGHAVLAYSLVLFHLDIPLREAIGSFTFANISTLVQNAVRAIPLGPSDSLFVHNELIKNINKLHDEILKLSIEEFGINSMGIEFAQIKHEKTISRLFMS